MRTLLLAVALLLAAPASSALAAGATVTGDAGSPTPLGGAGIQIRHLAPEVAFSFADDEQRYAATIQGPNGAAASSGQSCVAKSLADPERVSYQGNGTYTVILVVSKNADDSTCAEGVEQRFTFTIAATTAVSAAGGTLLTRKPLEFASIAYAVPVQLNPGADAYELRYAAGATVNPDGSLAGSPSSAFVDPETGRANVTFPAPGRYTFVARAKTFRSDTATPWSAPVAVTVVAPFDLDSSFADSRGPSYKIVGTVRQRTATGTIKVTIAKGKRGTRFRKLATVRIRPGGRFTLKFRLRRPGTYVLKYTYRGNATVAAGFYKEAIKITRFRF